MGELIVQAKTQRIVVSSQQRIVVENRVGRVINKPQSVTVVNAGPQGPPGVTPVVDGTNAFAEGTQDFPSLTWIMDYELDGRPTSFRFFDENGDEWEPAEITYINPSRSVAQWPDPIMGSWYAS